MRRGPRYGLLAGATAAALVAALPFLIPATAYKGPIEGIVSQATGRSFTIRGPLHFTLFPEIGIRADDIALANMPHARAPAMLTAGDMRIGVPLAPLLGGHITVSTIVLDRPVIALEVDPHGRANWTFARSHQGPGAGRPTPPRIKAHFSGLKIVQGKVTYFNARTGGRREFDEVDATIALGELDQPAHVEGAFMHAGQRVSVRAKVGTPQLLLQDKATALDLLVSSDFLRLAFRGQVSAEGRGAGLLKIAAPSARRAALWLGARLPDSGGLNALSLESDFQGDNKHAEFSHMRLALDGATITGALKLDASGEVPAIRGALQVDRLDLNPYIERRTLPGRRQRPHDGEAWSEKPVTLSLLNKLDADLALDTGPLTIRNMRIERAHIVLSLARGHLAANLDPVALYGGTGRAVLDVDASSLTYHNKMRLDRVALRPFLSDTIGVHQIEGTGTVVLDVASQGDRARTIMGALEGSGSIDFRDGRLRGVDLGAVARTIQHLLGSSISDGAFTEYAELEASFTLAHGVLSNQDFHLAGPVLQASGSGQVDIGNRTIDFRIEPKATAIVAHERLAIGVPFRITGPWRHLHYKADVERLVNGVIENLEAGRAPFKGLFGSPHGAKPATHKKKHKSLDEALKNMLGIH
jgi:AsmA protein